MSNEAGHWYAPDGKPMHFVPCKTREGTRPTNVSDARKLGLFPSVTGILRVLDKPALNDWKIRQAVYAVVTAPTLPNEDLDSKIVRVLEVEKQQDQESKIARDTGDQVHNSLELAMSGQSWDHSLEAFVEPVLEWIKMTGKVVWTEKVLVGDGYAGRSDLLLDVEILNTLLLTDFKTCSKLPTKGSWLEHRLQTSAYAKMLPAEGRKIVTCNVYLSTKEPGKYAVFTQDDWQYTYNCGFRPVWEYWMWLNDYIPKGAHI